MKMKCEQGIKKYVKEGEDLGEKCHMQRSMHLWKGMEQS